MKKLIKIFTSVLLLSACSEHDVLIENEDSQSEKAVQSEIRTIDEAYDIAAKAISWIGDGESRTSVRLLPSKRDIKVVMNNKSRSGESSDTLMYVVNFEDEQGFAIIPANRTMPELLAVTENGSYDPETGSEVEPFQEYMDNAMNILVEAPERIIDTLQQNFKENVYIDEDEVISTVVPKAPYTWCQSKIEGQFCENGICGCGPLAAALCMAYYKYPQSVSITYPNDTIPNNYNLTLNWDNLRIHDGRTPYVMYNDVLKYCVEDVPINDQIALGHLCREIGYRMNATYNPSSTSTITFNIRSAISDFGFTLSALYSYNEDDEKDILYSGKIIYAVGADNTSGHAWVIDGYKRIKRTTTHYIVEHDPFDLNPTWELKGQSVSYFSLSHHNWGWKGSCNGWFYIGLWSTNNAYSYDNEDVLNTYNYNFSNSQYYFSVSR